MKSVILASFIVSYTSLVAASPTAQASYTPSIQWGNCTQNDPPNLECGRIKVPIDWGDPMGEQLTVVLSRVNATNRQNRIGNLFFNPGGPGVSTLQISQGLAAGIPLFGPAISERFDIISPDPRGVGLSNPINCDPDIWNERPSILPKNQSEFHKLVDHNQRLGESCLNRTGPLLYHVDTASVAKDFEAIRIALNDGKISWLAISYGTQLAGNYAELFPDNIRAMALDGLLDHSQSKSSNMFVESTTYEDSLNGFFEWCEKNKTCAVHSDDVATFFDELVAKADKTPIPAQACSESGTCQPNVTGEDILFNSQNMVAFRNPIPFVSEGWPGFAEALNLTAQGNASTLSTLRASEKDLSLYPNLAVGCIEWPHSNRTGNAGFPDLYYKELMGSSFLTPHNKGVGGQYGWIAHCIGWPTPIANPPHYLNRTAMNRIKVPILLVNAFHDPETSYVWAQGMLDQIPSGVLLSRNGYGHTSIFLGGEAAGAMGAYLVNGTVPKHGTVVDS